MQLSRARVNVSRVASSSRGARLACIPFLASTLQDIQKTQGCSRNQSGSSPTGKSSSFCTTPIKSPDISQIIQINYWNSPLLPLYFDQRMEVTSNTVTATDGPNGRHRREEPRNARRFPPQARYFPAYQRAASSQLRASRLSKPIPRVEPKTNGIKPTMNSLPPESTA